MSGKNEEYILGDDVTARAGAETRRGTVVLSVRVSVDDMSRLEKDSHRVGKSLSELVRDALRGYIFRPEYEQSVAMVSSRYLNVSIGEFAQTSEAQEPERIGGLPQPEYVTSTA